MLTSVVQLFGAMLSSRVSHGKKTAPTPKGKAIRETVSYPHIEVTAANDSCLNSSMPCEHILACGHIIITAKPDEPCAPNCHHIVNGEDRSSNKGEKRRKSTVSEKDFYCDACIESQNETLISNSATPTEAGTYHLPIIHILKTLTTL